MVNVQARNAKYSLQVTGQIISQIFKNSVAWKWMKDSKGRDTSLSKNSILPMLCSDMKER